MSPSSSGRLPVAVDAMGGDLAPAATVAGALLAAKAGVPVVLVGDADQIGPLLPPRSPLPVHHASEVVAMDEAPAAAVRRKPDSSLVRALSLVAEGEASAVISCGHTGALLVGSVTMLGVFDGVERPAIATLLPRADGKRLVLLDAGANVDCRPEQLACFATLGAAYAEALGTANPRVGLLSNGSEAGKGNMLVRATLPMLESLPLDVVGNVEPTAALDGACDVLVCDGFVGNVVLKSLEGAVDIVVRLFGEEIQRRPTARAGTKLMTRAYVSFRERVAWDAHGGALLVGTRGVVVVGHGRANPGAVSAAIRLAHRAVRSGVVDRIERRMTHRGG